MASLVRHVTFDCADPYTLAGFWAAVLDGTIAENDLPGDPEVLVTSAGTALLFIAVPDAKVVKNRLHVDLQPQDRTRDEEVERLLALGATVVGDHRKPDGAGWVTMADPVGNEFCVERSAAERTSAAAS
ncbi:VOC family protein [Streptomyces sp. NPDC002033]|uniref:VOC family protein n=1 Tax=unclassified Streptomyces TaxID=2593676 RepID=UPI00331A28B8